MVQCKRASSRVDAGTSGFLSVLTRIPWSLQSRHKRVTPSLLLRKWTFVCLSSCLQGDSPLVKMSVGPAGFSGRCTRVSVPLRVVPSSTGLLSKRCPGIGFLSRADREIGVFRHVAPPTRLRLEFPRETSLILRCAGKVGNPFTHKAGELTLLSQSRGEKGLRGSGAGNLGVPLE